MSGGVPAGEHDPECGLLYEDGTEHCTCKLLPCPFCGGEAVLCDNTGPKLCTAPHAFMRCLQCACEGPEKDTASEAIAAWNTRATPTPPIKGRDADVERAIKSLRFEANFQRGYGSDSIRLSRDDADTLLAARQALGERP